MTPNEYRKKHRRCATCEYYQKGEFHSNWKYCYKPKCVCVVKNKYTKPTSGIFCQVYKAREFKG